MIEAKKSLGQHWLEDPKTLKSICDRSNLSQDDVVLEIGPGLGGLTRELVKRAKKVIAVELDERLAIELPNQVKAKNLEIFQGDILNFNLVELPAGYKVVANIPYYLTSNLIRTLAESVNPPSEMALLVQKEVAERICAKPGDMSTLSVSVQLYYSCKLGLIVPAEMFRPPSKVDSQVVYLKLREKPLFDQLNAPEFFRIVKAGFSERRKKLRSSLAGGLKISREECDKLIKQTGIDPNKRPQELNLQEWHGLYKILQAKLI